MNFFEYQEKARKKTGLLVFYFIIAIVLILVAIDAILVGAMIIGNANNPDLFKITINGRPTHLIYNGQLDFQAITLMSILVGIIITPITLLIIFLGTMFKIFALRRGGISVAEMVNAVPIEPNTRNLQEKRLINVVEEMAIASGMIVPKIFVMKEETSINAFVAGFKPSDTILVVTQGALDNLNRDELQGVIGHEFSHIFNSDMGINLRLMGLLAGILIIGQLGLFLLRSMAYQRRGEKSNPLPFMIVGLGLFIVGYVGLFFGRLIKAAILRERESLADASSVQYTRNPESLVSALLRIKDSEDGTYLRNKHAEDVSHLCFCQSRAMWFENLLATHPPLDERIKALDPQGIYSADLTQRRQRKGAPAQVAPSAGKTATANQDFLMRSVLLGGAAVAASSSEITHSIGNITQDHIDFAKAFLSKIPPELDAIIHDPLRVALLFYALLWPVSADKDDAAKQLLSKSLAGSDINVVMNLHTTFANLDRKVGLPLLDIALPAFRANTEENRQTIYQHLLELVSLDKETLHGFALLAIISKNLVDFRPPTPVKYEDFSKVLPDVSTLLSFVIATGHQDPQQAEDCYNKTMLQFTNKSFPQPATSDFDPVKFQLILSRLNQLSPPCKDKLIQAILSCIEEDKHINVNEAEIVRAIAAYLGAPIPPILVSD